MEPRGFPETTTRCVMAQKSEILNYFAAKAWNLTLPDRLTNCSGTAEWYRNPPITLNRDVSVTAMFDSYKEGVNFSQKHNYKYG